MAASNHPMVQTAGRQKDLRTAWHFWNLLTVVRGGKCALWFFSSTLSCHFPKSLARSVPRWGLQTGEALLCFTHQWEDGIRSKFESNEELKNKWETCNCQSGLQSAWDKEEEKGVLQSCVATCLMHDWTQGQQWLMLTRGPIAPLTWVKVWVWISSNSSKLTCLAKLELNRDIEAALLHSSCTCVRTRTTSGLVRSETKLKAARCLSKG